MTVEKLIEISRVISSEHAEDIGIWLKEMPYNSPLGVMLAKYQTAQFQLLREMREYIDG